MYEYYSREWDRKTVDQNIFREYDKTTTQFSAFDPNSIMLYPIPAELTTNGFYTSFNTHLSDMDKTFIACTYPAEGFDIAVFNTLELRQWDKPAREAVKRQTFPTPYNTPPSLAVGLTSV